MHPTLMYLPMNKMFLILSKLLSITKKISIRLSESNYAKSTFLLISEIVDKLRQRSDQINEIDDKLSQMSVSFAAALKTSFPVQIHVSNSFRKMSVVLLILNKILNNLFLKIRKNWQTAETLRMW
ncbi:unnamed protein product [Meganyctiphanes norvegica]|uniref:Uncharacterized protein n=1 Tax=Meganyctiphanes norvegica TaxID=48144 RepID=A0AAV2SR57_MEGNR